MNKLPPMNAQAALVARISELSELQKSAAKAVRLLKTLANEHRLLIMCVLSEGERSVNALNEKIDLSQSALSQHLAVLRSHGLVQTRRESQTIYYALADSEAIPLIETLHDCFCPNEG